MSCEINGEQVRLKINKACTKSHKSFQWYHTHTTGPHSKFSSCEILKKKNNNTEIPLFSPKFKSYSFASIHFSKKAGHKTGSSTIRQIKNTISGTLFTTWRKIQDIWRYYTTEGKITFSFSFLHCRSGLKIVSFSTCGQP